MIGALGLVGGKYRLVRELGRGAFGAVYAARLEPSGEPVALKILARFDQGRSIERFKREINVLSRIPPHPNIVRVFESGEHGGLPFVVMELVVGGSLAAALKDGKRPTVAQAAKIAEQVTSGLDHLHRAGVVHRDVNANNVLIDEGGNVRLVDFGLALDQQRVTRITETGELLGTPLTFAPEQLDGKAETVGAAADIYATAALLYELLTGHSPFQDSKSFRELAQRIRTELPPPADEINPQVPRGLARAVELGLSKRPEDRPKPASELGRLIVHGMRSPGSRTTTNATRAQILGEGPRHVGPYEIVLPLGRGRRGMVYSARLDKKEAALRVLAVSGELAGAFAQFVPVCAQLAKVSHPAVIATYGAAIDEGYGYVATELVRGETLAKLIERDRKVDPATALEIAGRVARGVEAVHAAGLFHGELRTDDVLLDPETGAKVGDFMLEAVLSRTKLEPAEAKARDIQALGALLVEMLTGRRLAPGTAPRLEAIERKGDALTRAAAEVALRALDKQPQLRHADAAAFAAECEALASGLSLLRRAMAWLRRPGAEAEVERARVALVAVAGVLLVVAALALRSIIVSRHVAEGDALLDRARAQARAGARPEEVGGLVGKGLALTGEDEARLLDAGRTLMATGDVAFAARCFREAAERRGSREALLELDRTEEKVEQCLAWAGESAHELAKGEPSSLLVRIARARVLADDATASAEKLRAEAQSFGADARGSFEVAAVRAVLFLAADDALGAEQAATAALDALALQHDAGAPIHDARATEPRFVRACARLARRDSSEVANAEHDLNEVLTLVPGHVRARAVRAHVRALRSDAVGARDDLDASKTGSFGQNAPAVLWRDRAAALLALAEPESARQAIDAARSLDPKNARVLLDRARVLVKLKRWDEAAQELALVESLGGSRADLLHLEKGRLALEKNTPGDDEIARKELDQSSRLNPGLVDARRLLLELERRR
ncbi:MAG TPA: protein kinase [Planctomycetota bacterium]|nr:protein kinase [Planctomycetota bacterium]